MDNKFKRGIGRRLLPWIVIAAIFAIWELIVRIFGIPQFVLPAPSAIFAAGWKFRIGILDNSLQTLMTTLIGFALAVAFGSITGILIGSSSLIYEAFYPALIGFNAIPKVAIVPLLVIWFGIGTVPAVLTAFLISFFPILVNVATGIATTEPELRDVLRALGASPAQIVRKVGLPRTMPYFFASLKIAMPVAFVGSILAETVAANKGIGSLMLIATARFDVALAFAALLVTGLMGMALYWIASLLERRVTGWSIRGASNAIVLHPQG